LKESDLLLALVTMNRLHHTSSHQCLWLPTFLILSRNSSFAMLFKIVQLQGIIFQFLHVGNSYLSCSVSFRFTFLRFFLPII